MLGYHSAVGGVCTKAACTTILLLTLIHLRSYLTSVGPAFSSTVSCTSWLLPLRSWNLCAWIKQYMYRYLGMLVSWKVHYHHGPFANSWLFRETFAWRLTRVTLSFIGTHLAFAVVELQVSQRASQFSQLQYLEVGFFVLRFLVSWDCRSLSGFIYQGIDAPVRFRSSTLLCMSVNLWKKQTSFSKNTNA